MIEDNFIVFVKLLKSDDEKTWEKFYFVMRRVIMNWLRSKDINYSDAEDIYQNSIITFYNKLPKCEFESYKKMKSFIFAIVDRKIKESYRIKHKTQKFEKKESQIIQKLIIAHEEVKSGVNTEIKQLIRKALKSLKPIEKKVIILYYYRKLSHKEIAKRIGISVGNCRVIKLRAMEKLKKTMTRLM